MNREPAQFLKQNTIEFGRMEKGNCSEIRGEVDMTEQDRIKSIKKNGGQQLKHFKPQNITYEMCLVAVQNDGEAIEYVPGQFRTKDVYREACKKNGAVLRIVPNELKTKELCEEAVASNGGSLQYVPEKLKTKALCRKAVGSSNTALSFVPDKIITPEFVTEATKKVGYDSISSLPEAFKNNMFYYELVCLDPEFIWYIPRKACTAKIGKATIKTMGFSNAADAVKKRPELLSRLHKSLYDHDTCLNFVSSDYFKKSFETKKNGSWMSGFNTEKDRRNGRLYLWRKYTETYSLPDIMKWSDVSIHVLKMNGYYLKYALKEIINEEMCKAAISSNSAALKIVPEHLKTKEICEMAFEDDPFNIEFFPEEYITQKLAEKAVRHSGFILEYIPEKFRTHKVCLIAIKDDGAGALEFVPRNVLDKEICLAWLAHEKWPVDPLEKIPRDLWDYDICFAAVSKDGDELKKIPEEFIDEKMCLAAAKESFNAVRLIPKQYFTTEIAEFITKNSCRYFEEIPEGVLNEEICINAIKHGERYRGTVLKSVPERLKTQKMCNIAVRISPLSFKDVPEQYVTFAMIRKIAKEAPGRLKENFPKKYHNKETIEKLMADAPGTQDYLNSILREIES